MFDIKQNFVILLACVMLVFLGWNYTDNHRRLAAEHKELIQKYTQLEKEYTDLKDDLEVKADITQQLVQKIDKVEPKFTEVKIKIEKEFIREVSNPVVRERTTPIDEHPSTTPVEPPELAAAWEIYCLVEPENAVCGQSS